MFGLTRCYTYSQIFPYECLMVIQDRFRPPLYVGQDLVESQLSSQGMEGLRHKGWTWATTFLIVKVGKLLGLCCSLLGQGDNQ